MHVQNRVVSVFGGLATEHNRTVCIFHNSYDYIQASVYRSISPSGSVDLD